MKTHEHRLPASPEEWSSAYASSMEQEYCSHCSAALTPALSITNALEAGRDVPSLRGILMQIRREYGPWAVAALCFECGDVAVWPITVDQRRKLAAALVPGLS